MRPSRASVRASISLKRQSTTPLKIGAPTDFRRVQSFRGPMPLPTKYRPLDLSIHRSGNRLSDLPSFDSFQLDELCQCRTLAVPPRALPSPSVQARRCLSSDLAEVVPRKPIGSGGRRSSGHLQHWSEQPQPVRITSALIPHFSAVYPVETSLPEPEPIPVPVPVHVRPEKSKPTLSIERPGLVSNAQGHVEKDPYTPLPIMNQDGRAQNELLKDPASSNDSPSSASSRTTPSRISSLQRSSTSKNRKTIASVPLPNRMSQWFFAKEPCSPRQVSLAGEKGFAWERTRTLSGTTVASNVTTITASAKIRRPNNASISSTFTQTTTPRASLRGPSPTMDKALEAGFYQPPIYEVRPQHRPLSSEHGDHAIGLAF